MMILEVGTGSLLTAEVDALVNSVNVEGVMGKGLALQFKRVFPAVFAAYAQACKRGEVVVGRMHVVELPASPRFVINFPTKKQWRQPSKLEYVESGLVDLVATIRRLGIQSIAIPLGQAVSPSNRWPKVEQIVGGLDAPVGQAI